MLERRERLSVQAAQQLAIKRYSAERLASLTLEQTQFVMKQRELHNAQRQVTLPAEGRDQHDRSRQNPQQESERNDQSDQVPQSHTQLGKAEAETEIQNLNQSSIDEDYNEDLTMEVVEGAWIVFDSKPQ